jgi:hypothetical protein
MELLLAIPFSKRMARESFESVLQSDKSNSKREVDSEMAEARAVDTWWERLREEMSLKAPFSQRLHEEKKPLIKQDWFLIYSLLSLSDENADQ